MNKQSNHQPCIHVLTVHWQSPKWINVQLSYLARNLRGNVKTYAWLNGIDTKYYELFDYVTDIDLTSHARKLNKLAHQAIENSNSDSDILLFIDGDAFPIRQLNTAIDGWLEQAPLAAVQRLENNNDIQPHPCFCVTTIKFWKEIKGDWRQGYTWKNSSNQTVTDVGGNLLGKLQQQNIEWKSLLRSNRINIHPLWFGIYADIVYHHGAGFRPPISRVDLADSAQGLGKLTDQIYYSLPKNQLTERLCNILDPVNRRGKRLAQEKTMLCNKIFEQLERDPGFYKQFN